VLTVASQGLQQGSTFTVDIPVFSCDLFTPEENAELMKDGPWEDRIKLYRSFGTTVTRGGLGAGVGVPSGENARRPEVRPEGSSAAVVETEDARNVAFETTTPANGSSGGLSSLPGVDAVAPVPLVPAVSATAQAGPREDKPLLRRVLLVDDVASNLKMAARILQRSGVAECLQAVDGQAAVDAYIAAKTQMMQEADLALRQQRAEEGGELGNEESAQGPVEPFDAILMDFEMPVMNGPTATAKLRALGCTAPIIGITGNVLPGDVQLFREHGANAVLPKPLRLHDLHAVLLK
jgi:CheY-like chemotaxis protein